MHNKKRTAATFAVLSLLLIIICVCSMIFGSVTLPFSRIAAAFAGDDRTAAVILFGLRLPRLLAALLAGAGLAVSGILLQTVTDNGLCAPNIIGVNAGAGFFVMLNLCIFPSIARLTPVSAFVGALAATLSVLGISRLGRSYEKKTAVVLAGVALSSFLNAGIAFLSLEYPDVLSSYTAFSVGGFYGVALDALALPAVICLLCFVLALFIAPKIRLFCLGDEAAASLGVNVGLARTFTVIICSALCAAVVSFAGLLGFVGLIVPHIVRRVSGAGLRCNLFLSVFCGAFTVALSDFIGRTAFSPWEIPAGVIMAFVGAPFFIFLIVKRRKTDD